MHSFLQAESVTHPIQADTLGCQVSGSSVISCSCDSKFCRILTPCLSVSLTHPFLPLGNEEETFHPVSLHRSEWISEWFPQDSSWVLWQRKNEFMWTFFSWPNIKRRKYIYLWIISKIHWFHLDFVCLFTEHSYYFQIVFDKSVLLVDGIIS